MFKEEHKLTIMYNMLCGLNFLHTANIMHRDIKPANILVNTNCSVKYCDFGLSSQLQPEDSFLKKLDEKNDSSNDLIRKYTPFLEMSKSSGKRSLSPHM